jgi:hypothetical protein
LAVSVFNIERKNRLREEKCEEKKKDNGCGTRVEKSPAKVVTSGDEAAMVL